MIPYFKGRTRAGPAQRRRSERHTTAALVCPLGTIVNISRHGVLVRAQGRFPLGVGADVELELAAPAEAIAVPARVVRVRQVAGGRVEAALDFAALSDDERQAVENLARFGKRRPGAASDPAARDRLLAALRLPDHYATLGLAPDATDEQVQAAFRAAARRWHPDLCRDADAAARFCAASEAYEALADPDRRHAYDDLHRLRRAI